MSSKSLIQICHYLLFDSALAKPRFSENFRKYYTRLIKIFTFQIWKF